MKHTIFKLLNLIFLSFTLFSLSCMENIIKINRTCTRTLSLQEYCIGFFKQDIATAGKLLTTAMENKTIPDEVTEALMINATILMPPDYLSTILEETPLTTSLYPLMGLALIRKNVVTNQTKEEKQKKINALLNFCTDENDKDILKVFGCCLKNSNEDEEPITNTILLQTALDHHKKNVFEFLRSQNIEPSNYQFSETIERVFIDQDQIIKAACQSEEVLKNFQKAYLANSGMLTILNEATFKFFFISRFVFAQALQQIKILKELGFQLCNDERGYNFKKYTLKMMRKYNNNLGFLNIIYAILRSDNWEDSTHNDTYENYKSEIIKYYTETHPENTRSVNLIESYINDAGYIEHLPEFMQFRQQAIHFCCKVFKVLKDFYPHEFERLKSTKKATKDYCETTELWKPYNIPKKIIKELP